MLLPWSHHRPQSFKEETEGKEKKEQKIIIKCVWIDRNIFILLGSSILHFNHTQMISIERNKKNYKWDASSHEKGHMVRFFYYFIFCIWRTRWSTYTAAYKQLWPFFNAFLNESVDETRYYYVIIIVFFSVCDDYKEEKAKVVSMLYINFFSF